MKPLANYSREPEAHKNQNPRRETSCSSLSALLSLQIFSKKEELKHLLRRDLQVKWEIFCIFFHRICLSISLVRCSLRCTFRFLVSCFSFWLMLAWNWILRKSSRHLLSLCGFSLDFGVFFVRWKVFSQFFLFCALLMHVSIPC